MSSLEASVRTWVEEEDGQLRKSRVALIFAAFYLLFAATYLPINAFSVGRTTRSLFLPGEERLPFLPVFEYLYVLTYFLPAMLVVTIRDFAALRQLMVAALLTLGVSYTTYLVFPVYFERPPLVATSVHTWLLSLEYLDKPYNHFPSLHVALTWLAVLASQVPHKSRVGLYVLAAAISVSTMFVKQHYLADVVYGFVLALATWRFARQRA